MDRTRKGHAKKRGGHETEPHQGKRAPTQPQPVGAKRMWHLNEECKAKKANDPKKWEEKEGKENRYV